jgi:TetR/AcrR family fatty acid metabolism transcriptional regulator
METPKTPKGRTTRKKILDSSIQIIIEKGFSNTTLNDMCRASGVAIGTFYHYFSSTQDILAEILRFEGEEMSQFFESLEADSAVEALKSMLVYQLDYFEKKGKEIVAHIYTMEISARHGGAQLLRVLPLMNIITDIIKKAQASKELREDLDPQQCATLFLSLIFFYSLIWLSSEEHRTLKEIALDHLMIEIERRRP